MKLGIRQIYDAAISAGFTPDQATTWTAIALAESGGETGAENNSHEESIGLWQINLDAHENKWGDLHTAAANARAAYEISNHGTDMRPWTTTHASHLGKATDYRTHLDEVRNVTGYQGDDRGVEGYGAELPPPLPPSQPTFAVPTSTGQTDLSTDPGSKVDTDKDGLTDAFERIVGSSPDVADTDQDGLSDSYETVVSRTDVLLKDTDEDTLSDSSEVTAGTSGTEWDTDLDGASDGVEVQYGGDPLVAEKGQVTQPPEQTAAEQVSAALPVPADGTTPSGQDGVTVAPQDFQGKDPWEKVSIDGETVDNFTAAALEAAAKEAGTDWRIMQGSFSDDVAASGSTHTGGGVVDIAPTDGDWEGAVTALRKIGFAAWVRNVPGHGYAGGEAHIHAVLMGDELLSDQAAIQVESYLNNDNGLKGSTPDDGPRQFVNNRFSWEAASGASTQIDQVHQVTATGGDPDSDDDGLSDIFEQMAGSDPMSADSNGDGQSDAQELLGGDKVLTKQAVTAALSTEGLEATGDEDADGLSNRYELKHGLDPRSADTDADGLEDSSEVTYGTDGTLVDTDFDGVTDSMEIEFKTDPLTAGDPTSGWAQSTTPELDSVDSDLGAAGTDDVDVPG
jgi:hypothetical protein